MAFRDYKAGMMAATAIMMVAPAPALAQTIVFDLPAQSLEASLKAVSSRTGANIIFAPATVAGRNARPLKGSFTASQAVSRLVSGAGLSAAANGDGTILVRPAAKRVSVARPAQLLSARPAGQALGASVDDGTESDGVEIVVTAQRREERLIDVPQSVSVLSVDDLAKSGITQFRDFADLVPGVSFTTFGAGYNQISMRGVTSGFDVSPTVGIYVDDVPYGSTTALASSAQLALDVGLFDMDRIEVLRGPQGTLYGASSMGGLIKYITRKPDAGSFGAEAQAGISSTRDGGISYNGAAAINAPIATDVAAIRVSGFYSHDGGYIDNIRLNDSNVNRSNVYGGRLDLLLQPTDRLSVRLGGYLQNIDRRGSAFADYSFNLAAGPSAGRPATDALAQDRSVREPFEQKFRLLNGTLSYDLDWAALTSITGYQTSRTNFVNDVSALYVPFINSFFNRNYSALSIANFTKTNKFTQEVRLVSQGESPVDWVVGGFYTRETADFQQAIISYDPAGLLVANDVYTLAGPSSYKEYAAFGDVTWHVTDRFDVSGGLRYSHNRQSYRQIQTGILAGAFDRTGRFKENVVTYLANASYKFNDRATLYVRYATGYRPGGPNAVGFDPVTGNPLAPPTYEADRLRSYEAGFRAETADRAFGIDMAAYYIDWSNFQVITSRGGFSVRLNAPGGAEVKGVELNLTARPTRGMIFTGGFAFQDATLSEADADLGGVKGERLPNVAKFTATLSGDYRFDAGRLPVNVGATLRYLGDRTSSFTANFSRSYLLPDYVSVDLRAGATLGPVELQIYGRNIFDTRGKVSAFTGYGVPYIATTQPRTIGLTATTRF
nr:TonB-dependent receptor [Sphingomonas sp. Y57]